MSANSDTLSAELLAKSFGQPISTYIVLYIYFLLYSNIFYVRLNISALVCFQGDPGAPGPAGEPVSYILALYLCFNNTQITLISSADSVQNFIHRVVYKLAT